MTQPQLNQRPSWAPVAELAGDSIDRLHAEITDRLVDLGAGLAVARNRHAQFSATTLEDWRQMLNRADTLLTSFQPSNVGK